MSADMPGELTPRESANARLNLKKVENGKPEETIWELRKVVVINGVPHDQFVWINQLQLRGISIDHGL